MDIGPPELLIILAIVLLLFGGAKLPKLARSLGEASKEFRKAVNGHDDASANAVDSKPSAEEPAASNPSTEGPATGATATEATATEATATEAPATRRTTIES